MHFLPYSIYGEMIESIGRLEVDAYCGELAFLYQMLENVEYMITNYRPVLGGEHYLTGEEVCQKLCISKRTLQDYTSCRLVSAVSAFCKASVRCNRIVGKELS